jgi:hypothetical protein
LFEKLRQRPRLARTQLHVSKSPADTRRRTTTRRKGERERQSLAHVQPRCSAWKCRYALKICAPTYYISSFRGKRIYFRSKPLFSGFFLYFRFRRFHGFHLLCSTRDVFGRFQQEFG